jgi:nitrogen-specific signal transduction histidine kinase
MSTPRIPPAELPGPSSLARYRSERYSGDENAARLAELPETDARRVSDLYRLLKETLETANAAVRDNAPLWLSRRLKETRFTERVQEFAAAFSTENLTDEATRVRFRTVYHDARGGALTAVLGMAQLLELKGNEVELAEVYGVFNALRDHLKILRNCFIDLDPIRRERDRAFNAHSAKLFRQKWDGYQDGDVGIEYISDFDGEISSSCLEFSSVERAIYNLVNNAMSHTADGLIRLYVLGLENDTAPENVRIATANAVDPAEERRLRESFGDRLGELFMGGFTIGGSGLGLSICTELVANAYGLGRFHDAIDGGYVGADILHNQFVAWIHWPTLH